MAINLARNCCHRGYSDGVFQKWLHRRRRPNLERRDARTGPANNGDASIATSGFDVSSALTITCGGRHYRNDQANIRARTLIYVGDATGYSTEYIVGSGAPSFRRGFVVTEAGVFRFSGGWYWLRTRSAGGKKLLDMLAVEFTAIARAAQGTLLAFGGASGLGAVLEAAPRTV